MKATPPQQQTSIFDETEILNPNGYSEETVISRLKFYLTPNDGRFEDLLKSVWPLVMRDFVAGLIVAMVAIPLAMGLAIASSLNPVHGIVGGAVAGGVGAIFGGSKYQVYGPTAAFIPVIAGIINQYGSTPETYAFGYGILIFTSIVSGIILLLMGTARYGRFVTLVPHSIVVGFTVGIACVIIMTELGEVLGLKAHLDYAFFPKVKGIMENVGDQFNIYCVILAVSTFVIIKLLLRVTIYIPGPVVAVVLCVLLSQTVWADKGLITVGTKYGVIPRNLLKFTTPSLPPFTLFTTVDIVYRILSIVFVSAVESLLCSRLADRLAKNTGIPFNPNKELFCQGMVQILVPLLNGFPHTGALARTATNIKLGAISPLAGIIKMILKLTFAVLLADFLELIPMACIGGILTYVAINMIHVDEIREVLSFHNTFHTFLMCYTAVTVLIFDFSSGVISALLIYIAGTKVFNIPDIDHTEKISLLDSNNSINSNSNSNSNSKYTHTDFQEV